MLGIRYVKVEPTDFVMQHSRGKLIREGAGLSFLCFAPVTEKRTIPQVALSFQLASGLPDGLEAFWPEPPA